MADRQLRPSASGVFALTETLLEVPMTPQISHP